MAGSYPEGYTPVDVVPVSEPEYYRRMSERYSADPRYVAHNRYFERERRAEGSVSRAVRDVFFDPKDELGNIAMLTPLAGAIVPVRRAKRAERALRLVLAANKATSDQLLKGAIKGSFPKIAEAAGSARARAGTIRQLADRAWGVVRNADYKRLAGRAVGAPVDMVGGMALGVLQPKKHWGWAILDAAMTAAAVGTWLRGRSMRESVDVDSAAQDARAKDARDRFNEGIGQWLSVTNSPGEIGMLHKPMLVPTVDGRMDAAPGGYYRKMRQLTSMFRELYRDSGDYSPEYRDELSRQFGEYKAALDSAAPPEMSNASTEHLLSRGEIVTPDTLRSVLEQDTEEYRRRVLARERQNRKEGE